MSLSGDAAFYTLVMVGSVEVVHNGCNGASSVILLCLPIVDVGIIAYSKLGLHLSVYRLCEK